jgi:hypothetical protein
LEIHEVDIIESLKSKIVTKDLASNGEKFYKTNEVGEWICKKI